MSALSTISIMEASMVFLVIVLLGALSYLSCQVSKSTTNKKKDKWTGEDIGESLIHHDDEGIPFQSKKPKKKRKYTKRKKK